jgi:hypothetical protein|tara:strand:- start:870 stop:1151 length:282 start_codon:yes stop_codon:yes gene_type:complete
MHLQDPYVASPADHLGYVTITIDDQDGTEPHIGVRAEIRLMDDDGTQVAARTGDPHYMPEDWQERAIALIQEFRAATALIHDVSAAPPPAPEE